MPSWTAISRTNLMRELMKTTLRLYDGRRVTVEQTMTGIYASVEGGKQEPVCISSEKYMQLIMASTPCEGCE